MLLHVKEWGPYFTSEFSVLSIMAGWIAEMVFMLRAFQ